MIMHYVNQLCCSSKVKGIFFEQETYLKHLKHEGGGGICKFKLILFIVGTKNCADYVVLHDYKIVILNCGQIMALFRHDSGRISE